MTDSLSSQGITTYAYNAAQRITTTATSYGGTAGPQVTYTYDGGRLTARFATSGGGSKPTPRINTTYSYDAPIAS